MNENYFTRVPDALYDALRDGEITPLMFNIMLHLHRWANWGDWHRPDSECQEASRRDGWAL